MILIVSLLARLILVPVFLAAGLAKLADMDRTREMMAGFGVRQSLLRLAAVALPLFELGVAATLIAPPTAFAGALAASAILMLFTGVILFHLAQGRHPDCNCFGQIGSAPIGPLSLARNSVLTGLALLVVAAGPGVAATWRLDLVFGITPLAALGAVLAIVALTLLLLILGVQVAILQRLAHVPIGAAATEAQSTPKQSRGLPAGSLAPSFGLSDTEGDFITLEQLLAPGRSVILLFIKPDCPPCAAMAGEVERWQRSHAGLIEIVRITDGVAAPDHYALLQARGEVARVYDCWGTPSAVLILPDGRIGSLAAQGAGAIRALVKRTVATAILEARATV